MDGSEPSLRAVDWAADEAALRGLPLRVVYASLRERYERAVFPVEGERTEQILSGVFVAAAAKRARKRAPDVKVSTQVMPDGPTTVLVREARNATVLIVGSRGRGDVAELLLGSVSLTVAGRADCPVIVVSGDHGDGLHCRVVLGVGEEAASANAVRFALEEAERRGTALEAIRAWRRAAHETTDHPQLAGEPAHGHEQRAAEGLEAALREAPAGMELHKRTAEDSARKVLLDASHGADLLVVGRDAARATSDCNSAGSPTRCCITPRVRSPWCPNGRRNRDGCAEAHCLVAGELPTPVRTPVTTLRAQTFLRERDPTGWLGRPERAARAEWASQTGLSACAAATRRVSQASWDAIGRSGCLLWRSAPGSATLRAAVHRHPSVRAMVPQP
ncbi:universal stress protein family [Streptomyces sp. NL15-2K]|nr:universal stress protein family [Streptomyces sp. NL15-2K]